MGVYISIGGTCDCCGKSEFKETSLNVNAIPPIGSILNKVEIEQDWLFVKSPEDGIERAYCYLPNCKKYRQEIEEERKEAEISDSRRQEVVEEIASIEEFLQSKAKFKDSLEIKYITFEEAEKIISSDIPIGSSRPSQEEIDKRFVEKFAPPKEGWMLLRNNKKQMYLAFRPKPGL